MKDYKEVVAERYDGREADGSSLVGTYSLWHPVGFHMSLALQKAYRDTFLYLGSKRVDLKTAKILDLGSGFGATTRFMAEITRRPQLIFGIDLSQYRVAIASEMNPAINYRQGDISEVSYGHGFDIINASVVLSHFSARSAIESVLAQVYDSLSMDGHFIWMDIRARDHFDAPKDVETWGFSLEQMDQFARVSGFENVFEVNLFKSFFGRNSATLYGRLPKALVQFAELFPFPSANVLKVYKKCSGQLRRDL